MCPCHDSHCAAKHQFPRGSLSDWCPKSYSLELVASEKNLQRVSSQYELRLPHDSVDSVAASGLQIASATYERSCLGLRAGSKTRLALSRPLVPVPRQDFVSRCDRS